MTDSSPIGKADGGIFSVETLSVQMAVSCVKLT